MKYAIIVPLVLGALLVAAPSTDDEILVRSFSLSRGKNPSPGQEMVMKNQTLVTAAYHTMGFDFSATLVHGTSLKKLTASSMIKNATMLEPVKIEFGDTQIMMSELTLPVVENIAPEVLDRRKGCEKKTVSVCLSKEEFKANINSALVLEALALIYLEEFKDPYEYSITGHGWLYSVSKPEVENKDGELFLKVDVTLLLPSR